MKKTILGAILGCAVLCGVVWQFGYLSKQTSEATKKIERATAVARAEKAIETSKKKISELDDRAREYRIKAGTLERRWTRDSEAIANLDSAMKRLAARAKEAGLPSPSNRESMTDEQRATTLKFGAKTISAPEVYSTLARWKDERDELAGSSEGMKATIDRTRAVAEQIEKQRGETKDAVAKLEARLEELRASKDLAKINAELAEMEANAGGAVVGDLGETLETIQNEIDELNASADEYRAEAEIAGTSGGDSLTPDDVVAPSGKTDELEALWN